MAQFLFNDTDLDERVIIKAPNKGLAKLKYAKSLVDKPGEAVGDAFTLTDAYNYIDDVVEIYDLDKDVEHI